MEKRLILKPVPRSSEGSDFVFDKIDLGVGATPRYIVVLRGNGVKGIVAQIASNGAMPDVLSGCPVVWLPEGAELEVYEVEL